MNGGRTIALLGLLSLGPAVRPSIAQCPDGSPPPCAARAAATPAPNSVAVLYFENLSPDTGDAYLADGLTEEITSRLGDIRRLLVKQASRQVARRLRETAPDYRIAVGRVLGVRYLAEGSLRRSGPRVRVVARLVNVTNGFAVWSQTYDRAVTDLLSLEEDIAREVATAIAGRLVPAERSSLAARPTRNTEAYEHFLRGNYYLAKRSAAGLARAVTEYELAARLDPTFARAVARGGFGYALHLTYGWTLPGLASDSMRARALELTRRALEQDSAVSDAWLAKGYVATFLHPSTFDGATAALDRALALDPNNAEALQQYSFFLRLLGRDSAARAAALRSLAIEPERPITLSALGSLSFIERRFDDARRWLDSSLHVNPDFYLGYIRRARTRLQLRDPAGARADAQLALGLGGSDSSLAEALLAMADVQMGDFAAARIRMSRLLTALSDTIPAMFEEGLLPAAAFVTLGEHDAALKFLERVHPRGVRLRSGLRAPEFDPIRSDPRFQHLVEESRSQ